jgi:hypothetical protein
MEVIKPVIAYIGGKAPKAHDSVRRRDIQGGRHHPEAK